MGAAFGASHQALTEMKGFARFTLNCSQNISFIRHRSDRIVASQLIDIFPIFFFRHQKLKTEVKEKKRSFFA